MATPRTKPTQDQIQYLFNQNVDDAVSPPALVFGIKGVDATSGGYTAFSGDVLGSHFAMDVKLLDGVGNQVTSFGGGTQYADGAGRGTATGTLMMGDDGTNIQSAHMDSAGDLQIDVLTMPTITVNTHAVTATDLDIRNLTNVDVITAELSAVDNAVLDAIELDTTTIAGAVSGTEMQVDVITMPSV